MQTFSNNLIKLIIIILSLFGVWILIKVKKPVRSVVCSVAVVRAYNAGCQRAALHVYGMTLSTVVGGGFSSLRLFCFVLTYTCVVIKITV